jgi:hypothetical protein
MAGGNLDFLKGMALKSAQLAVNYVKGEGGNATNSSQTSNVTAVIIIVYQYCINITYFTCDLPVLNLT